MNLISCLKEQYNLLKNEFYIVIKSDNFYQKKNFNMEIIMRKFEKISFEQFKKDIKDTKELYDEYIDL